MRVFKAYFLILNKYKGTVFIFFAVFMSLSLIMAKVNGGGGASSFQQDSLDIAVVDEDQGEFAGQIREYFGTHNQVTEMKMDQDKIADALYWRKLDYVLVIPEGTDEVLSKGEMPELSCMKAVLQICDDNDLDSTSLRRAPLSMVETLQEAAYEQMQAEASQMTASAQLPEAQEQALDEYPMPDEQVSTPDMQEYGYSYDGMFPVTRERALELDAAGLTVYVLHEDNTESMVFDPQEIMDHGGLFGVDHEEWEKSPQFHEKTPPRTLHQKYPGALGFN